MKNLVLDLNFWYFFVDFTNGSATVSFQERYVNMYGWVSVNGSYFWFMWNWFKDFQFDKFLSISLIPLIKNLQKNVVEASGFHEERQRLPRLQDIRGGEYYGDREQCNIHWLPEKEVPASGRPIEHSQAIRGGLLSLSVSYCSKVRPESCVQCPQRDLD